MDLKEIIKRVNKKNVLQIRAGKNHSFRDITIVQTQGRFFVRQYKFGKKSWRDAFLQNSKGQMKIDDVIIEVDGVVPKDLEQINPKINWAYHKKLPLIYFLMRLTYDRAKHEASTIELIPKI